ncbi:uncharacterized protein LOC100203503 [Hydra vulgaris]|uniref:Uncharacterized protein LOC100203503 n=1 Tax=Hydra vulgaris TaxID=6087 RepID=A0ABM4BCZ8_HYDVU
MAERYGIVQTNKKHSYMEPIAPCEESDSDEDENERRKHISLKGGHGFFWFSNKFSNQWDLTKDSYDLYTNFSAENQLAEKGRQKFLRNNNHRHTLRHVRCSSNPPIGLDNIHIRNEFEYGFNTQRPNGSKANMMVKTRPISLYLSSSVKPNNFIYSNEQKQSQRFLKENLSEKPISFAKNDIEALLEQEVFMLRAQPSSLNIHGSKGNANEEELAEDLRIARRKRFLKRQLSFDSHPRHRLSKTLSLESVLESNRSFKSFPYRIKASQSNLSEDFLLDVATNFVWNKKQSSKTLVSENYIRDDLDALPSFTTDSSRVTLLQTNISNSLGSVEKQLSSNVHVVSDSEEKFKNEKKRKPGIPNLLSAFRLPNKNTFKKFIRWKQHSSSLSINIPHDIQRPEHCESLPTIISLQKTEVVNSCHKISSDSCNDIVMNDKSSSVYSLARVDEDKESFEFGLERKSCSSCSISKNNYAVKRHENILERRMSDTALSCAERQGNSPRRKFVKRILSPVVCGLQFPDRYEVLDYSNSSLTSCDSLSIASEGDVNNLLFEFGSQELADEITLIDKELLIRIPWQELANCSWMTQEKFFLAPNTMKMVQFFNRIAMMVATSILSEETAYRRAKVIRKAIKLSCRCRYMKNYNSLKAVLSGMQCTPIFRLKATWKQVPSKYRRMFRELSELMSENNNFSLYQQELSTSLQNPPIIPFLGNFLTTVAHTHTYMAVQTKYKNQTSSVAQNASHGSSTSESPEFRFSNEAPDLRQKRTNSSNKNHSRSDSDDSGVVLCRLSHALDGFDISPRESCLSSPDDDENRLMEDIFTKPNSVKHLTPTQKRKSASHDLIFNSTDIKLFHKSYSVDNSSSNKKFYANLNNIINKRPIEPPIRDPFYDCELMFWKFQISAVQYKLVVRPYIQRFLVNCPFNTEEENYKLSLLREPPCTKF